MTPPPPGGDTLRRLSACFALAAQRYIRMFAAEGGMGLVQALLDDPELYDEIKHLARCLLDKCELYFMERPDEESS